MLLMKMIVLTITVVAFLTLVTVNLIVLGLAIGLLQVCLSEFLAIDVIIVYVSVEAWSIAVVG